MTVLHCDPGALRSTARSLRAVSAEIDRTSDQVMRAGDDVAWTGLASLEQAARRADAVAGLQLLVSPVTAIADGLDEVATAAEDLGPRARQHLRHVEDLVGLRDRMVALGPPTDPVLVSRWDLELVGIDQELARAQSLVEWAQEEFDRAQRAVAARLDGLVSGWRETLMRLSVLKDAVKDTKEFVKAVAFTATMASAARQLSRKRPVGERSLHRANQRIARATQRLEKAKATLRGTKNVQRLANVPGGRTLLRWAGRANIAVGIAEAGWDVVQGGGYDGGRGVATRVLAGGAVVGVAAAMIVGGPVVGAVGMTAYGAYQAWTIGNTIYDNRHQIKAAAVRTWEQGKRLAGDATRLVGKAQDRARAGLGRVRDLWSSATTGGLAGVLP